MLQKTLKKDNTMKDMKRSQKDKQKRKEQEVPPMSSLRGRVGAVRKNRKKKRRSIKTNTKSTGANE